MAKKKSLKQVDKQPLKELRVDFPRESLDIDDSRGFPLVTIKAYYIMARLTDVFGLCGIGWKYKYDEFIYNKGANEVTVNVSLYIRNEIADMTFWSDPITHVGGKKVVKKNITDAKKSAVTNGICKCASMLGVGEKAYKGDYSKELVDELIRAKAGSKPITTKSTKVEAVKTDTPSPACSECGEQMELKKGQYGNFWGCTSYPACRNTYKPSEVDKEGNYTPANTKATAKKEEPEETVDPNDLPF